MYHLGLHYEHGLGVFKDEDQAMKYYSQSSDRDNIKAMMRVAEEIDRIGENTQGSKEEALQLYEKVAATGNLKAIYLTGIRYLEIGKPKPAVKWLEQAAQQNHFAAIKQLANYYATDDKNIPRARVLYRIAAQKDDVEAMEWLTKSIINNSETSNYPEAIEWITKAAKLESRSAMEYLGLMYEYGKGIEQDINKAIKWYEKAHEHHSYHAGYALGKIYYNKK